MRHYSKVFVELPDNPADEPFAVVNIECDECGEEEIRIHMSHLGTVLRVLQLTVDALHDDGTSGELATDLFAGTPINKAKVRAFLDKTFPDWKAERIRRRGQTS